MFLVPSCIALAGVTELFIRIIYPPGLGYSGLDYTTLK